MSNVLSASLAVPVWFQVADHTGSGWLWRARVGEAVLRLTAARLLVAAVPFGYWRGWLGVIGTGDRPGSGADTETLLLARAVQRGAARLPFATKCLPRAVALHTMLRRRNRPSQLVLGVLDSSLRGSLDDLHAWVQSRGDVVIGALDQPFHPLIRFE